MQQLDFFQVAIHAIGDKANDLILEMYEKVISENGIRDRRFRVRFVRHETKGIPIVEISLLQVNIYPNFPPLFCMTGANLQIEHAQHLAPGTSDRFGKLQIVASVQVLLICIYIYWIIVRESACTGGYL